jgi:hypothetical protein
MMTRIDSVSAMSASRCTSPATDLSKFFTCWRSAGCATASPTTVQMGATTPSCHFTASFS